MRVIPQLVVSTLQLGGVYALIAVGLTLIFGVMRVVNFEPSGASAERGAWTVEDRFGYGPSCS